MAAIINTLTFFGGGKINYKGKVICVFDDLHYKKLLQH